MGSHSQVGPGPCKAQRKTSADSLENLPEDGLAILDAFPWGRNNTAETKNGYFREVRCIADTKLG